MALLLTHTPPLWMPMLRWAVIRLLRRPPSLPHANGRVAVSTTERPRMSKSANVGRLLLAMQGNNTEAGT